MPAAGSSTKVQGASNLNRRSQSFNSIDKNKPPQYANGNEKGKQIKVSILSLFYITYKLGAEDIKKKKILKGQRSESIMKTW